jgi:D-glycero-D-manno-heptose 1,7-bisphosphate phosphatase
MGVDTVKAVFLDRDGVLVEPVVVAWKPYPVETAKQMRIYPYTAYQMERLKDLGYLLILVSNQPDVARGTITREEVERMHSLLLAKLPLDDIFVCYHNDADNCACRKPKPGMMLDAAERYGIDLTQSFVVGDRWRDIDAGAAAGCRTVWIDRGYHEHGPTAAADGHADGLAGAVDWIIGQSGE